MPARRRARLRAEAEEAVIRAEVAHTYADGAKARMQAIGSLLDREIRAADARRRPPAARDASGAPVAAEQWRPQRIPPAGTVRAPRP